MPQTDEQKVVSILSKKALLQGVQETFTVGLASLLDADEKEPAPREENYQDDEGNLKQEDFDRDANAVVKKNQETARKAGKAVRIRRLTGGEFAQLEAAEQKGMKVKGLPQLNNDGSFDASALADMDMEIDYQVMQEESRKATYQCVAWGLSTRSGDNDDQWTPKEVEGISPPAVIPEIARHIYRVSGVTEETAEMMDRFQQDTGRSDDSNTGDSGDALEPGSYDDSGTDANTANVSTISAT